MQQLEATGLDRLVKNFDASAQAMKRARGEVLESLGKEMRGLLNEKIGGSGKVQGWQSAFVGSGRGYVAVRAKEKELVRTQKGGSYAVGYVTNAIESGHTIRRPAGTDLRYISRTRVASVPGKHMYRETAEEHMPRLASEGAKKIADATAEALKGG